MVCKGCLVGLSLILFAAGLENNAATAFVSLRDVVVTRMPTGVSGPRNNNNEMMSLLQRTGVLDFLESCNAAAYASQRKSLKMSSDSDDAKFGMSQRIDSVKCLAVGALTGSIAVAIPEYLHETIFGDLTQDRNGLAQFEFDCDAAAVLAGLFAIVYRYCIRTDDRDQLKQGVVSAFVLTRALSRIAVPASCSALPLSCGEPLGYLNWNMIEQLVVNGVESAVLFGAAAVAMDYCMAQGWISRFPG